MNKFFETTTLTNDEHTDDERVYAAATRRTFKPCADQPVLLVGTGYGWEKK